MTDDGTPPAPGGWNVKRTDDGDIRYDGPERRIVVICRAVSTSSGDVINCRGFASDSPYGVGDPETARVAVAEAELPQQVTDIADEIRGG